MNFSPIRYLVRRSVLKKIDNVHSGKYVSLDHARRVGFILDAALPESGKALAILCRELHKRKIPFCGIVSDRRKKKEILADPLPEFKEVQVLTRKNMNWYGLPHPADVAEFLSEPFDILIDLSAPRRTFTLDWLLKSAVTSLRIGTIRPKYSKYDIVIVPKENEDEKYMLISGTELARSIINYLTTIQ